jgi:hypothetical protein
METPAVKDTGLITLAAVSEERKAPSIFISEIPQAAEVNGSVSKTFKVLLAGFAQYAKLLLTRLCRLRKGVDVT